MCLSHKRLRLSDLRGFGLPNHSHPTHATTLPSAAGLPTLGSVFLLRRRHVNSAGACGRPEWKRPEQRDKAGRVGNLDPEGCWADQGAKQAFRLRLCLAI